MKLDRASFAALVATISTATVVGCAGADDPASQEGNLRDGLCIDNPGEGSQNPELYSFQEGTCFDLARYIEVQPIEGRPGIEDINSSYEGANIEFDDYLYDHCRTYSSQLRPAIAKEVETCLLAANAERQLDVNGDPMGSFSWGAMYDCARDTLYAICTDDDTIDNRSDGRCERIAANVLASHAGDRDAVFAECQQIVTGLRGSARQQIEDCTAEGWNIYTCVEGLRDDAAGAPPSEPQPTCVAPTSATSEGGRCDALMAKLEQEGDIGLGNFVSAKCNSYETLFSAPAADATIACLMDPDSPVMDGIYSCGAAGLRAVCRTPDVHAMCDESVGIITQAAETGGSPFSANTIDQLIDECDTLMPGLTQAGRDKVAACLPDLAADFARYNMAEYTLYSCVEGL